MAELWFGSHSSSPSPIAGEEFSLDELIERHPQAALGPTHLQRFGPELSFLLKLIAPAQPLSIQVHPSLPIARRGYEAARAGGVGAPVDYVDGNHKPELLMPLTEFDVLAGLRTARDARDVVAGIDHPLMDTVRTILEREGESGCAGAFEHVLRNATQLAVTEVVSLCRRHAPSSEVQRAAIEVCLGVADTHPGDPGVVASMLMVPHRLHPGEGMFVPTGTIHAYLSGLGVEIMANSDNVLRGGLTSKNVDLDELFEALEPGNSPMLIAPEDPRAVLHFDLPIDDFRLSVVASATSPTELSSAGPRIVLALDDHVTVEVAHPMAGTDRQVTLARGEAVFVADSEGALKVGGGRVVHATTPI